MSFTRESKMSLVHRLLYMINYGDKIKKIHLKFSLAQYLRHYDSYLRHFAPAFRRFFPYIARDKSKGRFSKTGDYPKKQQKQHYVRC